MIVKTFHCIYLCESKSQSCLTLVTPWTIAHQAPLSMEFSRQEYWSGLPFPTPVFIYIHLVINTSKINTSIFT